MTTSGDSSEAGAEPDGSAESAGAGAGAEHRSKAAPRKTRKARSFPSTSFGEALFLAKAIHEHGSGQRIRRLTLFEALGRTPDSGPSRKLVTSSNQYGITTGSYTAEYVDLTADGRVASNPDSDERSRLLAQFNLSIKKFPSFNAVYEKYANGRLPTVEVLRDAFIESGIDSDQAQQAIEIFLANARELGLVRNIGGSEHLVTIEQATESLPKSSSGAAPTPLPPTPSATIQGALQHEHKATSPLSYGTGVDFSTICFIISPIGSDDSVQRKHADLILGSLIEPAVSALGLTAVRADKIDKPGLITGQVIEHIARSALVIADLSFTNPNVFYELALRQAIRKPVVQICRAGDPLPFDVNQYRTYPIDMTDIYTLVPQMDLHKQEITRRCRAALEDGEGGESQLSMFYPQFWDYIQT